MKYYIVYFGEYDYIERDKALFKDEHGLFRTYREASEYLINRCKLEPYGEQCEFFGNRVYFEFDNGTEYYSGFIREMKVIEKEEI